jgi:hypothetical protein
VIERGFPIADQSIEIDVPLDVLAVRLFPEFVK